MTKLVGVTILTSLDNKSLREIGFNKDLKKIIESAIDSDINFDLLRLSGGNNPDHEPGNPIKLKQIYIKMAHFRRLL